MSNTPKSDAAPETTEDGGAAAGNAGQATQEQPSLRILGQYLKDLSFENPNAPQSLGQDAQPEISISVNVNARPLATTDFEVELHLDALGLDRLDGVGLDLDVEAEHHRVAKRRL